MKKGLPISITVTILLFLWGMQSYSEAQVKLYKVKSISPATAPYETADILWEVDGSEHSLFAEAAGRTVIMSFWGT